jgi:zinc transport system ATP-binding protein
MTTGRQRDLIEIANLSFSYGSAPILENVNLRVHAGDYLAITGENGSGKTTLLKLILGLLPLQKGEIKLFGVPLAEFKDWRKIAYVPQKATNFDNNFPITAEEVIMMGRYARIGLFKNPTRKDKDQVAAALRQVQMERFAKRQISDLSSGQQQRIFIARALVSEPEIVFLDEPTTGVDREARRKFFQLLQTMNKKLGLTILLISHEIDQTAAQTMRAARLNKTLQIDNSPAENIHEELQPC